MDVVCDATHCYGRTVEPLRYASDVGVDLRANARLGKEWSAALCGEHSVDNQGSEGLRHLRNRSIGTQSFQDCLYMISVTQGWPKIGQPWADRWHPFRM